MLPGPGLSAGTGNLDQSAAFGSAPDSIAGCQNPAAEPLGPAGESNGNPIRIHPAHSRTPGGVYPVPGGLASLPPLPWSFAGSSSSSISSPNASASLLSVPGVQERLS